MGRSIHDAIARRGLAAKPRGEPAELILERAVDDRIMSKTGVDVPLNVLSASAKTLKDLSACRFRKHDIAPSGHQQQRAAHRLCSGAVPGEESLDELVLFPAWLEHLFRRESIEGTGGRAASVFDERVVSRYRGVGQNVLNVELRVDGLHAEHHEGE